MVEPTPDFLRPSPSGSEYLLGFQEARLLRAESDVQEIKGDVKIILSKIQELDSKASFGSGSLWVIMKVGSIIGFLVFAFFYGFNTFWGKH